MFGVFYIGREGVRDEYESSHDKWNGNGATNQPAVSFFLERQVSSACRFKITASSPSTKQFSFHKDSTRNGPL
jgi:hypothetical protein